MPRHQAEPQRTRELSDARREHYRYLKQRTYCEMCGSEAIAAHCKIVCTSCGYRLTCSDPM